MSISGVGTTSTNASSLATLLETSQNQGIAALLSGTSNSSSSTSSTSGTSSVGGDSATISGPGQLFSQLQQLQSQDPTAFKQLTSTIATQLQSASQQATGNESTFLSNLASKFETASATGSAASLQPQHHGHAHGTYNSQGQVSVPPALSSNSTGDTTSTSGTDLGQLFATISKEVTQALGA